MEAVKLWDQAKIQQSRLFDSRNGIEPKKVVDYLATNPKENKHQIKLQNERRE